MNKFILLLFVLAVQTSFAQQSLFEPQNIKQAYQNNTRSKEGIPGKNYWQNTARYSIEIMAKPSG